MGRALVHVFLLNNNNNNNNSQEWFSIGPWKIIIG